MDSIDPVRALLHLSPVLLIHSLKNRCEPDPILHQHMVEMKQLHNTGVKSGAIKEDAVMVGVPQGWRLIAAPPQMDSHAYPLIFWEPANDDDHTPQASKVVRDLCCVLTLNNWHKVGACIHGAEKISSMFGDPNADHIRLQCTTAVHNLKSVPQLNPLNKCTYPWF